MDATCARWQFMGSRWSGVTICQGKKLVQTKHQNWDHQHTAGRFDKNQRSSFLRPSAVTGVARWVSFRCPRDETKARWIHGPQRAQRAPAPRWRAGGSSWLGEWWGEGLAFGKKDVCGLNQWRYWRFCGAIFEDLISREVGISWSGVRKRMNRVLESWCVLKKTQGTLQHLQKRFAACCMWKWGSIRKFHKWCPSANVATGLVHPAKFS